jgi:hypothetical protein
MDGRRLVSLGLLGLLLAACGSGEVAEGKPGPAAEARKAPAAGDGATAKAAPEEAAPAKAGGRRVAGTAVAATDGGPGPEGRIELALPEGEGSAGGTLALDGRTIALEGVFDGEHLRLWAAAGVGDPAAVRRGFVFGKAGADGALAGDFALSDSGGAWNARGTWNTAD